MDTDKLHTHNANSDVFAQWIDDLNSEEYEELLDTFFNEHVSNQISHTIDPDAM